MVFLAIAIVFSGVYIGVHFTAVFVCKLAVCLHFDKIDFDFNLIVITAALGWSFAAIGFLFWLGLLL